MSTKRQKDADKLDYALFMALEHMRSFHRDHPQPFQPARITGDDRAGEAFRAVEAAISRLRHYYVRPLMDPEQRSATSGNVSDASCSATVDGNKSNA